MSNEAVDVSLAGSREAIRRMLASVERTLSGDRANLARPQLAVLCAVQSPTWTDDGATVRIEHEAAASLASSVANIARNHGLKARSAPVATAPEQEQYTYHDVYAVWNGADGVDNTWGEVVAVAPGEDPQEVAKDIMCEREPHMYRDGIVIIDWQEVSVAVGAIVHQLPADAATRLLAKLLDRDYRDRINDYAVLYRTADMAPADPPRAHLCQAIDAGHAEERAFEHYPDADVVWVVEGARSAAEAFADYYAEDHFAADPRATVDDQRDERPQATTSAPRP